VGDRHRRGVLQTVADHMSSWTGLVRQEKGIYHTLNKLSVDVTHRVLIGEAWVPASARQQVQEVLRITAQQSSTQVSAVLQRLTTHDPPPTYFKTNKFTECFQNIVDAYGVARYREVNPAVYTIMTFPFLFAVMFGDLGHGVLMLLFALLFVLSEKSMQGQELSDMVAMVFGGRYCILLMSFFSMYVGFLYNEFFSIPMAWWGGATHFACSVPVDDIRDCLLKGGHVMFPPGSDPYPFGIDPIWHGTKTELPFLNSLKMKMSILIGVVHMNLGILMSLYNNVYFRDTLSTLCEFIPQIIFLNGLFGYLSFLIVFKWVTGSLADLYHVMIYMFLNPGVLPPTDPGYLFPGQGNVQLFLLLVSLITVPIMLLPKPLILNARNKAHKQALRGAEYHVSGDDEENITGDDHSGGGHGGHGGQFDFSEVLVHQMIHTIEFVLGAVSNTASYLRLWALSLAHSQLSAVFYDRVLMAALKSGSPVAMFVGFFVFACSSFGVLMVMESLSAFLHALRLHWVEFQNKFYRGDGYAFTPFSTKFVELEASA
jgi:V-type H+-transporting ATPase subunit a